MEERVIVIGGGVAGLTAARELSKKYSVTILEARERMGGRIFTQRNADIPFDLGAEFVHGKPPSLLKLIREGRFRTHIVPDRHWRYSTSQLVELDDFWEQLSAVNSDIPERGKDRSFLEILEKSRKPHESRSLAHAFVEGFHGAPAGEASARAILKNEESSEEIDGQIAARLDEGYGALVDYLADRCRECGVEIVSSAEVVSIDWRRKPLTVRFRLGAAVRELKATYAIVTLPIGVLRSGAIDFKPLSEEKIDAIQSIEAASVTKVSLHFRERFWPVKNFGFIHSEDEWFPTCWADERGDILTVWAGGPRATELNRQSEEFITHRAVETISKLFGENVSRIQEVSRRSYQHNWDTDRFTLGAYSFTPVAAVNAPKILAQPEAEAIFFAGEATDLNHQNGTVHAAIDSGLRVARQIEGSN